MRLDQVLRSVASRPRFLSAREPKRPSPTPPKTILDQKKMTQHGKWKNTHSEPFLGINHFSLFNGFLNILGDRVGAFLAPFELLHVAVNWQGGVAGQALQDVTHELFLGHLHVYQQPFSCVSLGHFTSWHVAGQKPVSSRRTESSAQVLLFNQSVRKAPFCSTGAIEWRHNRAVPLNNFHVCVLILWI